LFLIVIPFSADAIRSASAPGTSTSEKLSFSSIRPIEPRSTRTSFVRIATKSLAVALSLRPMVTKTRLDAGASTDAGHRKVGGHAR
jgi:hypothetical protein